MKPQISIITPILRPIEAYLREAYESLCSQKPTWEWLLQYDGEDWSPPKWLSTDPRVKFQANGRWLGVSATRNRALIRAKGDLIKPLDGDDFLPPNALNALSECFEDDGIAYACGRVLDIMPNNATTEYPSLIPYGPIKPAVPAKVLLEFIRHTHGLEAGGLAMHPQGVMWRKKILFAYGGWPALTSDEDTCLLLSASIHHPGIFIDHDVMFYRRHKDQTTSQKDYNKLNECNRTFTLARIEAMEIEVKQPTTSG